MGKRKRDRQPAMWVTTTELPTAASHPFYRRLNQLLGDHGFDDFVEDQCAAFYAETMGRPSLPPGIYFRLLLIGYFEGIDSERGIAWRAADSLALRGYLGLDLTEAPPDHSTISRTQRLIDLETHQAVFTCRCWRRLSTRNPFGDHFTSIRHQDSFAGPDLADIRGPAVLQFPETDGFHDSM
jgi:hypothetical protein